MYNGFTWTDEQARESFEKRHGKNGTPRVAKPLDAKEVVTHLIAERLAFEVAKTRIALTLHENSVFPQVGAS